MSTGSLQVQRGKYYAVLNVYIDGKRKQKWIATDLPVAGNKRAAEKMLAKLIADYDARHKYGTDYADRILFSDFLADWLEITKSTIEFATWFSYKSMFTSRIDGHFRELRVTLGGLEPRHIRTLHEKILRDGCKPNTVIHYHAVIRKALQYALKNEMVHRNVADLVERPKKNVFHVSYYSREELERLFEATAKDSLSVAIHLGAYYGLRRSEVIGLRWSAIDFKRKTVTINHKVSERHIDGEVILVPEDKLKTKSSFRTLPLIPAMEKLLLAEKEKQTERRELFQTAYCTDYLDYVCVDELGNLLRPNYVTGHFEHLLKKHGLKKVRFHDLRHSCASLLVEAGIPMKAIQEWLGHSTFATTADIYSHLDFNAKINAANAIGRLLGGGEEGDDGGDTEGMPATTSAVGM